VKPSLITVRRIVETMTTGGEFEVAERIEVVLDPEGVLAYAHHIPSGGLVVLVVLASLGADQGVEVATPELMQLTGLSRGAVLSAIQSLEERRAIYVDRGGYRNVYQLGIVAKTETVQVDGGVVRRVNDDILAALYGVFGVGADMLTDARRAKFEDAAEKLRRAGFEPGIMSEVMRDWRESWRGRGGNLPTLAQFVEYIGIFRAQRQRAKYR